MDTVVMGSVASIAGFVLIVGTMLWKWWRRREVTSYELKKLSEQKAKAMVKKEIDGIWGFAKQ